MLALIYSFFGTPPEIWAVEIVWTAAAIVGFVFSIYNFIESIKDLGAVEFFHIQNGRRLIARSNAIAESLRAIAQMIYITIGIWALSLPHVSSHFPTPENFYLFGLVFRYGLLIGVLIVTFNTVLAFKSRNAINENSLLINQQAEKDKQGMQGEKGERGERGERGPKGDSA